MSQQPGGIEHAVDDAIADDHHQGDPADDLQTSAEQRQDPDDPEGAIRSATEQARGEDD